MVALENNEGFTTIEKLRIMDCTDFVPWIMNKTEIEILNKGQEVSLTLYTVVGVGETMQALFRGDRKARLSVAMLAEKNSVFRGIVDEIFQKKNVSDEWGFAEDQVLGEEDLGLGDAGDAGVE